MHSRQRRGEGFAIGFAAAFAVILALSGTYPGRATSRERPSGEAWPPVTPAERSLTKVPQDPEADGVILNLERNGKIIRKGDDIVNALTYHVRFKILTERGKRYADVHVGADKFSRVSNIQARTIKPDGTVLAVSPDQIFEKVVEETGGIKRTEWVFSFPAAEPGAILEYRYERHDSFLGFLEPWFFAGPEFTLRSRMTQAIPVDMGYAALCVMCPNVPTQITEWREGKLKGNLYTRELSDLPGYREEQLMPPPGEATPRMEFALQAWRGRFLEALGRQDRLFIDWPSVSTYVHYYYDEAIKKGQPALKPVVEGWLQGVADPQDRVRAILRHVQEDFRYIPFYTSVIGRVRPMETLLKERTADNEEKGVLLLAALKAIGVEAQAALTAGKQKGALNPKFISLSQFTHAVVAVPQPGGAFLWLDPTITYAPYGFMPWKDSGATALLVSKDKGEIVSLPVKNELSATKYRVTVRPRRDGKADLEVEVECQGEDAIDLREALAPAAESARLSYLQDWVVRHRAGGVLQSHAIDHLDEVDKPLLLKLSIEAPGLVTMTDEVMLVRTCVLSCDETNPISRGSREFPFYIDRGWNEEETVMLQPPAGMAAGQMPPPVVAKSAIGIMTTSCMSASDGAVRCSRQFVARRSRWPASEHAAIRAMYEKIVEADRSSVAFEAGEPGGAP